MRANWDERYKRGEHGSVEPHPLVRNAATFLSPGRALDVACGAGRHTLLLAAQGWQVTAVDASRVALELLQARAAEKGLVVDALVADLTQSEFVIAPEAYDLVVVTCYLQRDLFPVLRAAVKPGGLFVGVIALVDADPEVKPMNPDFLLAPGELAAEFVGWELLHDAAVKSAGKRALAELIARRPL